MTAVSLSLPDEVAQRLQRLSQRTGRTRTFFILEAIWQHLDDLEDLHLAEQRLIDLRARRSRVVPLEDVMERIGMQHRA